ncbi:MAG: cytochrome c1 [Halomonadaceae bacterium]|nr:MAG: cytochrome c1 [Halomonadaceae bacterium]
MRMLIAVLMLSLLSPLVMAADLDRMSPNVRDKASMQRGAQIFTNNCMGCHSAEYQRYKMVADDLGIPVDLYEENLIFTGARIGELMKIAMPKDDAEQWFGVAPPDLTLVARVRGSDWLYSFFRGFYADNTRPLGVNNTVYSNVGMPHVLADMGGLCAEAPRVGSGEAVICDDWAIEGSMDQQEFDRAMYDLSNFLVYLGEPALLDRKRIGAYVLIFLGVFFIFAFMLNREYWKDIH